ncbi:MAG: Hpt domain-containing protein [Burkholderiales bacterium]|nr:Hpt domain-containing protein [Burkholderiales bacterium]
MNARLHLVPASSQSPVAEAGIDSDFFLSTFGTDPEARVELVDLFIRVSRQQMQALADAHLASDWRRVSREAHALKGSLGIFGARAAISLLEMLESACADGAGDTIRGILDELEGRMVTISVEIEALRPS